MGKASQAGKGKVDNDNVVEFKPQNKTDDAIPTKKCINEGCNVETSTPYAKTHNKDYLCSRVCEQEYKARNGGGAWGPLPSGS